MISWVGDLGVVCLVCCGFDIWFCLFWFAVWCCCVFVVMIAWFWLGDMVGVVGVGGACCWVVACCWLGWVVGWLCLFGFGVVMVVYGWLFGLWRVLFVTGRCSLFGVAYRGLLAYVCLMVICWIFLGVVFRFARLIWYGGVLGGWVVLAWEFWWFWLSGLLF